MTEAESIKNDKTIEIEGHQFNKEG